MTTRSEDRLSEALRVLEEKAIIVRGVVDEHRVRARSAKALQRAAADVEALVDPKDLESTRTRVREDGAIRALQIAWPPDSAQEAIERVPAGRPGSPATRTNRFPSSSSVCARWEAVPSSGPTYRIEAIVRVSARRPNRAARSRAPR